MDRLERVPSRARALEHTSILTTGVLEELDLAAYGLTYWCRTTNGTHMFGDGTRIVIEETAEATAASIEQLSPADAAAWVELGERSQPVLKAFGLASEGWVPPPAVANGFARLVAGRSADPLIELTQLSVAELVTRWFENPYVRAMAMFRSVFSGLAPWTPGSAAAFLLTVAGHGRRAGRPVGGSQALVDALCAAVGAAGGTVRCGFDVVSVRQAGSSWSVRSRAGEEVAARRGLGDAAAPVPARPARRRCPAARHAIGGRHPGGRRQPQPAHARRGDRRCDRVACARSRGSRHRHHVVAARSVGCHAGRRGRAVRPGPPIAGHARHVPQRADATVAGGVGHDVGERVHAPPSRRPLLGGRRGRSRRRCVAHDRRLPSGNPVPRRARGADESRSADGADRGRKCRKPCRTHAAPDARTATGVGPRQLPHADGGDLPQRCWNAPGEQRQWRTRQSLRPSDPRRRRPRRASSRPLAKGGGTGRRCRSGRRAVRSSGVSPD